MGRYRAVLFDMFDTLVRFDRRRLPRFRVGERDVWSSVVLLHPVLEAAIPGLTLETFYAAFLWSYQEAERRRAADHREITAADRFALLYEHLGVDPSTVSTGVTQELLRIHMACLAGAAVAMPGQAELLIGLRGRYQLGVVSNFDYSPTVERILRDGGIRSLFEAVVVSDAVGWRKPRAVIFETAFQIMGIGAGDCLFVGDRPDIDVAGAKAVGMDSAWLNPDRTPLPGGLVRPDYDLANLSELARVLDDAGSVGANRA
jgi:FMN phosphatase YigB (HAD superfamily)